MSELAPTTHQKPAAAEQWSPSGAIIVSLIGVTALFFALTLVLPVILMAAMTVIDVPH